jgi:hypothetical protein
MSSQRAQIALLIKKTEMVHKWLTTRPIPNGPYMGANWATDTSTKTNLKAEIIEDAWASLNSDTSRPFDKPKTGRIAVKVINHLGDEVMKVFRA